MANHASAVSERTPIENFILLDMPNPAPLKELYQFLDTVNIDLKGFSRLFYNKLCEAEPDLVLETIKTLKATGVWVGITNLNRGIF
jgi:pyruvate-formate lyase-activating enzyme